MLSGMPFDGPIGAVRVAYSTTASGCRTRPTRRVTPAHLRHRRRRARLERCADGDVAIMMVEAGGTENAFEYYDDGAPKVTEEVIAGGLEAAKPWIRESIELQRELVPGSPAPRPTIAVRGLRRLRRRRLGARRRRRRRRASPRRTPSRQDRAQRRARRSPKAESSPSSPSEFAGREQEIKAAVRSLTKKLVRQRIVDEGVRIDGRGPTDIRPLSRRGRRSSRPAHGIGAVPARRDPDPRRRPRWACCGWSSCSTRISADETEALHAPLQLPAVLHR